MADIDSKFYQKKKGSSFYIGIWFLVFTVLATAGLYFFTTSVAAENESLTADIADFETRITAERSDKNVQIYSIYEKHKWKLKEIEKQSEIPLFVSHLKKNFQKYGLEAQGFDYNDGVISVDLSSETGDSLYAYQKIVQMLREYALDEKALFELGEISSFSGHDEISYAAEFRLK